MPAICFLSKPVCILHYDYGDRADNMHMRADQRVDGTSSSRLLLLRQGDKLRRYLEKTVLPFSKHYAPLAHDLPLIHRVEDLRHLPFTTKRDVQENPHDFILIPDKKILARRPSTIARVLGRGRKA